MKALTLHQPYASLVALGVKSIETRSWGTAYRGPIAVHAGKQRPDLRSVAVREALRDHGVGQWGLLGRVPVSFDLSALPLGAVVATATLADVVPIIGAADCGMDMEAEPHACTGPGVGALLLHRPESSPFPDGRTERGADDQLPYGDFTPGRYAWLLEAVIPCVVESVKGRQGLWEWTP